MHEHDPGEHRDGAVSDDEVVLTSPLLRLRKLFGPPRDYRLTRWLVFRLLGFIYLAAFAGLIFQGPGLLGSHGLTPIHAYIDQLRAAGLSGWDVPTVFFWSDSDAMLSAVAWLGAALSLAMLLGYANLPSLLVLWILYGSVVRVGQTWFSFGWEIQILETTLLAAVLAHPWDPRPLRAPAPPLTAVVLMRWLAFRIMLGAGLIKLRGDACWTQLTCLDWHFETQPLPNPFSTLFHHAPHAVHAAGVVFNHIAELLLPWLAFGPRRLRLIAALGMTAFQLTLIASGNLAFLNWLTLIPILACFDDAALRRVLPRRLRALVDARPVRFARRPHRIWAYAFAGLVAIKSLDVVGNLLSHHQAMNKSYDRLQLVNTYGAFGSVGDVRHELVIEGTRDADPAHATWLPYTLPCQPGPLDRRPCLLGPYHRRLDWLIWFAAMDDRPRVRWLRTLVAQLLDGDPTVRTLLASDPFAGAAPTWVRIRRFVYHLQPFGAATYWTRDSEELWLPPVDRDALQ